MASASASTVPSGSISTGTSPAGLSARNSGRRSHAFSTFMVKSSAFSCRMTRILREARRQPEMIEDAHAGANSEFAADHSRAGRLDLRALRRQGWRICTRMNEDAQRRPARFLVRRCRARPITTSRAGLVQGRSRLRRRAARALSAPTQAPRRRGRLDALGRDGARPGAGAGAAARSIAAQPLSRHARRPLPATRKARERRAPAPSRRGFDRAVPPVRRSFFYLPFEHSEDLADQELSAAPFRRIARRTAATASNASTTPGAITRSSRASAASRIATRPWAGASTAEEEAFLKEPNSSF